MTFTIILTLLLIYAFVTAEAISGWYPITDLETWVHFGLSMSAFLSFIAVFVMVVLKIIGLI